MINRIFILFLFCALHSQHINNETGWSFYSSPRQSFYIFDQIEIDGEVAVGDGWYPTSDSQSSCLDNFDSCDVIGAFLDEVCVGWVYVDSEGYTTLPIMGVQSGDLTTADYCVDGNIPQIKVYDSSTGLELNILTSDEIPGWQFLNTFHIQNISFANSGIYEQNTGWNYYQSSNQAFYSFESIEVNDTQADYLDVIGAFKNNVCVGWININPNGYTSVPVMGVEDNLYPYYMTENDIPVFKVYDYSEGEFLNLISSDQVLNWSPLVNYIIEGTSITVPIIVSGCTDSNACNYNELANNDDGSCLYDDCTGECGGNAFIDDCGVCDGNNQDQDCTGECFGNAVIDECGICDDDPLNDCVQDCNGEWGGTAEIDDCGVCNGNNQDQDCTGECFG
ncbi:MAG: hypothetical protein CMG66_05115, partial [Candidatus Marinimicrobia bacterium]|nr:hypothetical protein [Candidatus Neomarinimicrobiota bacterium]